jgi:hypothetical protein
LLEQSYGKITYAIISKTDYGYPWRREAGFPATVGHTGEKTVFWEKKFAHREKNEKKRKIFHFFVDFDPASILQLCHRKR